MVTRKLATSEFGGCGIS